MLALSCGDDLLRPFDLIETSVRLLRITFNERKLGHLNAVSKVPENSMALAVCCLNKHNGISKCVRATAADLSNITTTHRRTPKMICIATVAIRKRNKNNKLPNVFTH